ERLIVLSTSAVAVCCCRDSRSSLSRRGVSFAVAAWVGEVFNTPNCFLGEGPDPLGIKGDFSGKLFFFLHWESKKRWGFCQLNSRHTRWFALGIGRFCGNIGNVHWLLSYEHPAKRISWVWAWSFAS